jgi:plasmid maintenance system antidote protein VapI
MRKQPGKVVDALRKAIRQAEKSGMTRYKLAQSCGVEQAVLSKLMRGMKGVRLDTAERIVNGLGKRLAIVDD